MKELNNSFFSSILLFVLVCILLLYITKKEYLSGADVNSIGTLLSPDAIDYTNKNLSEQPANCPKCVQTTCMCPACPTANANTNTPYNRDYRVLSDPLYPPEQRSDTGYTMIPPDYINGQQQPGSNYNGYFRYPTRGYPPPYQLKGYLVEENNSNNILSIFGRPKYTGSTEYEYYVSKKDINNNEIKIDIGNKREIFNGENIRIKKPIFTGEYTYVELKTEDLIQPPLY
jgi:hypothetical protein